MKTTRFACRRHHEPEVVRYIHIDPQTLTVSVNSSQASHALTVPSDLDEDVERPVRKVADAILLDVLYPAIEAEARERGRNVKYRLPEPDPWLVSLGLLMWQGIIQGLAWDAVRTSVRAALDRLRGEGLAPQDNGSVNIHTEVGFCWTEYTAENKLREVFFGLRRTQQRSESARRAAKARWAKRRQSRTSEPQRSNRRG